jgi:integrase
MWSGETKNDAARSIPIPVELGKELLALVVSGELPDHDEFYRAFKTACYKLNYSADLCVYSLRHTALTRAARKNAGAKVQNFAGHKNYKTTQKYIHLSDEDNVDVAASMMA